MQNTSNAIYTDGKAIGPLITDENGTRVTTWDDKHIILDGPTRNPVLCKPSDVRPHKTREESGYE